MLHVAALLGTALLAWAQAQLGLGSSHLGLLLCFFLEFQSGAASWMDFLHLRATSWSNEKGGVAATEGQNLQCFSWESTVLPQLPFLIKRANKMLHFLIGSFVLPSKIMAPSYEVSGIEQQFGHAYMALSSAPSKQT